MIEFAATATGATTTDNVTIPLTAAQLSAGPSFRLHYGIDFSAGSCTPVTGGCQLKVTFAPQSPGSRADAIVVKDNSGAVISKTIVHGTGKGPLAAFSPGVVSVRFADQFYESTFAAAVDAKGTVYFGDNFGNNETVLKLDPGATTPQTVAGTGKFWNIRSLAIDAAGDLFVVDGDAVEKVDSETAAITTIPLDFVNSTSGVAVDLAGNIFVLDENRVQRIDADTSAITLVAGGQGEIFSGDGGPAANAGLYAPRAIALNAAGDLFIAEYDGRVRKVDAATQVIQTIAGNGNFGNSGDGGPATLAELGDCDAITIDGMGNIYVADSSYFIVRKIDSATQVINTVAGLGPGMAVQDGQLADKVQLTNPRGLGIDSGGNLFFASLYGGVYEVVSSAPALPFNWPGSFAPSPLVDELIFNIGNAPLKLTSASVAGPFNLLPGTASNACTFPSILGAQSSCQLTLGYQIGAGTQNGALTLIDNALNQSNTQQQAILKLLYPKLVLSNSSLGFGTGVVGSFSGNQWLTISNTGMAPVLIQSISFAGMNAGDFSYDIHGNDCGARIAAQSSCMLDLSFTPQATGARSATLVLTTNGLDSPEQVTLTGSGTQPAFLSASAPALAFSVPAPGIPSKPQTLTLTNTGGVALAFHTPLVALGNGFTIGSTTCGPTLQSEASCTVIVAFAPTSSGSFSGSIYASWSQQFGIQGGSLNIPLSGVAGTQQIGAVAGDTRVVGDFDGDGKIDSATWQPSNGTWYVIPSSNPGNPLVQQWGLQGDVPVPGDYDGDGKTDFAVWRPSNGTWYVIPSATPGNPIAQQWGLSGDIPIGGDFDGDRKNDFAVWRPSNGTWYVLPSGNRVSAIVQQWGLPGDVPVSGDFDGDGIQEMAVWRPATGYWYILPSAEPKSPVAQQWGLPGDVPVPGDYDGDGITDVAVWRPANRTVYVSLSREPGQLYLLPAPSSSSILSTNLSIEGVKNNIYFRVSGDYDGDGVIDFALWSPATGNWMVVASSNPASPIVQQWGFAGDIPVQSDFDGDGRTDFAVWRPSNGTWYILPSTQPGKPVIQQWGLPGDVPVSGDFDGDRLADFAVWRPSDGTWYIKPSASRGTPIIQHLGLPGDVPVPGDFDGDAKTDLAVWRPSNGNWYVLPSSNPQQFWTQQWGLPGDVSQSGDFDGDGLADFAVWRPSVQSLFLFLSSHRVKGIVTPLGIAQNTEIAYQQN